MPLRELIDGIQKGDRRHQNTFYEMYRQPMMTVCMRYMPAQQDAEHVLLEGFCIAYDKLWQVKIHTPAAVHKWLRQIMWRRCIQHLKQKTAVVLLPALDEEMATLDERELEKLPDEEILFIIASLPEKQRLVFNLYVLEDMPHIEIAAELGITVSTSTSQLFKAKTSLQKLLISRRNYYGKK